jgi:AraC-like DNA-binding protein
MVFAIMIDRKYEKFLRNPDERKTISEIAYDLGFENMSYFFRLFKKETGMLQPLKINLLCVRFLSAYKNERFVLLFYF